VFKNAQSRARKDFQQRKRLRGPPIRENPFESGGKKKGVEKEKDPGKRVSILQIKKKKDPSREKGRKNPSGGVKKRVTGKNRQRVCRKKGACTGEGSNREETAKEAKGEEKKSPSEESQHNAKG